MVTSLGAFCRTPRCYFLDVPSEIRQKIFWEADILEREIILNEDGGRTRFYTPDPFLICKTIYWDLKEMMKTWLPGPDMIVKCQSPGATKRLANLILQYRDVAMATGQAWKGINIEILWFSASPGMAYLLNLLKPRAWNSGYCAQLEVDTVPRWCWSGAFDLHISSEIGYTTRDEDSTPSLSKSSMELLPFIRDICIDLGEGCTNVSIGSEPAERSLYPDDCPPFEFWYYLMTGIEHFMGIHHHHWPTPRNPPKTSFRIIWTGKEDAARLVKPLMMDPLSTQTPDAVIQPRAETRVDLTACGGSLYKVTAWYDAGESNTESIL